MTSSGTDACNTALNENMDSHCPASSANSTEQPYSVLKPLFVISRDNQNSLNQPQNVIEIQPWMTVDDPISQEGFKTNIASENVTSLDQIYIQSPLGNQINTLSKKDEELKEFNEMQFFGADHSGSFQIRYEVKEEHSNPQSFSKEAIVFSNNNNKDYKTNVDCGESKPKLSDPPKEGFVSTNVQIIDGSAENPMTNLKVKDHASAGPNGYVQELDVKDDDFSFKIDLVEKPVLSIDDTAKDAQTYVKVEDVPSGKVEVSNQSMDVKTEAFPLEYEITERANEIMPIVEPGEPIKRSTESKKNGGSYKLRHTIIRQTRTFKRQNTFGKASMAAKKKWKECHFCKQSFRFFQDLNRHIRQEHTDPRYQCSYCPARFFSMCSRMRHESSTHPEGGIRCGECSLTFNTKAEKHRHYKIHYKKPVIYQCEICNAYFERFGDRRMHCLKEHPEMFTTKEVDSWKCPSCKQFLKGEHERFHHYKDKHKGLYEKYVERNSKLYKCNFCSEYFFNKTMKDQHILKQHPEKHHRKPYWPKKKCVTCGKQCKDILELHEHCKVNHPESLCKYACIHCSDRFETKETRWEHYKQKHFELFKYKCVTCKKIFKGKEEMDTHFLLDLAHAVFWDQGSPSGQHIKRCRTSRHSASGQRHAKRSLMS